MHYRGGVRLHLCGVRGSTPATGPSFATVGGSTSSLAVAHDGDVPTLVLDAGTGLKKLSAVLGDRPFAGTIVLTHVHWDHVMGLPFFTSGDHPDAQVSVRVPDQGVDGAALLDGLMSPPFFPVSASTLRGHWDVGTYDDGAFDADGFRMLARELPHGGGRTMGLRVEDASGSFAYLPDHGPHRVDPGPDGTGAVLPDACALVAGVDVLFHDAQWTAEEVRRRPEVPNAAADYAVALAEAAGVGRLVLIHHHPGRTDDQVAALCAALADQTDVPVSVGTERDVIHIGGSSRG